jgi:hypothetical protein
LDLDDDLRLLQLALQAQGLALQLRHTGPQRVRLWFAPASARLQAGRLLRAPRGEVRGVQSLAPQQCADRTGGGAAFRFAQDAQFIRGREPPAAQRWR